MKKGIFFLVLLSVLSFKIIAQENFKKPNIIFFLVDDLGWADTEPCGGKFYETPNIKKLAQDGILFTQAYTANPVCSPTRASILSGKYPTSIQATNWFGAPQPDEKLSNPKTKATSPLLSAAYQEILPFQEITLAEALKMAAIKPFSLVSGTLEKQKNFGQNIKDLISIEVVIVVEVQKVIFRLIKP